MKYAVLTCRGRLPGFASLTSYETSVSLTWGGWLFADRTSCHKWWPNQFRLLLSSLAYIIFETIRRVGLRGTELGRATCQTIRLKLLKIGAVVTRNTRRIRFMMSSYYPWKNLFYTVAIRFNTS